MSSAVSERHQGLGTLAGACCVLLQACSRPTPAGGGPALSGGVGSRPDTSDRFSGRWTADDLALLGRPDDEVAAKIGRTATAVPRNHDELFGCFVKMYPDRLNFIVEHELTVPFMQGVDDALWWITNPLVNRDMEDETEPAYGLLAPWMPTP
jgi:hypothetical protein